MSITELCDQALAFHRAGRIAEAERLCAQIIAAAPGNFIAGYLLATIRFQQGRGAEAVRLLDAAVQANQGAVEPLIMCAQLLQAVRQFDAALVHYDKALALRPELAEIVLACGDVLAKIGRPADALAEYDRALAMNPDFAEAHYSRGNLLRTARRFDEALANYDRAVTIRPDFGEAWNNRGTLLRDLKRFEESLESCDRTLEIYPGVAEVWNNRGSILDDLKRFEEALASFDRAVAIKPAYAEAWNNRGLTLRALSRLDEALVSHDRAVAIDPRMAAAWNDRGHVLRDLGRPPDALASYDRALAVKPDDAELFNNRGIVLRDLKRFDDAVASYDKALAIRPDYAEALYNRGMTQWVEFRRYESAIGDLERALRADPDHEFVRGNLLHLRMIGGDWRDFEREAALLDAGVRAGARVADPFIYQALSESPADLQACARIYADYRFPAAPALCQVRDRGHAKIRLGYLSGEFRDQATAHLAAGLYELHDRDKFGVIAFDNGSGDGSAMRRRLEAGFDRFIDISRLGDRAAAEKILAEEIDILINLNGYFGDFRMGVFAQRPAPVQVSYLGFPATLGAPYIDYIIADRFVIPGNERQFYTEQVVYMPDSYQVNDAKRPVAPDTPDRAGNGLPETGFVFASFNQSYKLMPAMFAVWMRILKEVGGSVLWLLENNTIFPENLRREAERHGIAPERLVFAPVIAPDRHLARLKLADLFLDTLPYNAHTTASDALWSGLPLVTCRGKAFPGRVAASLLNAIGLPELITGSIEDYEALALRLARDPGLLETIREKLAQNRLTTPLFDTDRFRRAIEAAYTTMWQLARNGEKPKDFAVGD